MMNMKQNPTMEAAYETVYQIYRGKVDTLPNGLSQLDRDKSLYPIYKEYYEKTLQVSIDFNRVQAVIDMDRKELATFLATHKEDGTVIEAHTLAEKGQ